MTNSSPILIIILDIILHTVSMFHSTINKEYEKWCDTYDSASGYKGTYIPIHFSYNHT